MIGEEDKAYIQDFIDSMQCTMLGRFIRVLRAHASLFIFHCMLAFHNAATL